MMMILTIFLWVTSGGYLLSALITNQRDLPAKMKEFHIKRQITQFSEKMPKFLLNNVKVEKKWFWNFHLWVWILCGSSPRWYFKGKSKKFQIHIFVCGFEFCVDHTHTEISSGNQWKIDFEIFICGFWLLCGSSPQWNFKEKSRDFQIQIFVCGFEFCVGVPHNEIPTGNQWKTYFEIFICGFWILCGSSHNDISRGNQEIFKFKFSFVGFEFCVGVPHNEFTGTKSENQICTW